ncbi:unnamed protein product, partial [Ectocarpus sp. 8 AP-2014]
MAGYLVCVCTTCCCSVCFLCPFREASPVCCRVVSWPLESAVCLCVGGGGWGCRDVAVSGGDVGSIIGILLLSSKSMSSVLSRSRFALVFWALPVGEPPSATS